MKHTYDYDEIYGSLIYHNKEDTYRYYFINDCQYYNFYRWMFSNGWNLQYKCESNRNGLVGYEVTLLR